MDIKDLKKKIIELEDKYNFILPNVYIDFLIDKEKEGNIDINSEVNLYTLDELYETNIYNLVNEYEPDYIAIGSTGGGLTFLMKQERDSKAVLVVDTFYINVKDCFKKIKNFLEWRKEGFEFDELDESEQNFESSDLVLIKEPEDKIKTLLNINKILKLKKSSKELLELTKSIPCVIMKYIDYKKAENIINELDYENILEVRRHN